MPKRVTRFDAGELRKAERTPQGFLRAPAFATRTGVFTYRFGDGSVRRELRHPEDVFAADSLATLAGIPVTDDHPTMLVDAENSRMLMVGYTGNDVEQADDKFVSVCTTITDSRAIAKVEAGKVEVSCGYICDHEVAPGEYDGEPYDVRQRNIIYNHLAIVTRGRAGPDVRLRLDAADAVQVSQQYLEDEMEKITLNGVEFEVTPALKAAIEAAMAKAKSDEGAPAKVAAAETATVEQTQRADKAEARADGLKAELEKANAALAAKTDSVDQAVVRNAAKARVRVLKVAERVLPTEAVAKLDELDDKAIMVEVIKAECKGVNLDGKSDAYVEARFDGIVETLDGAGDKKEIGSKLHKARTDSAEPDAEAARKRQADRALNAWKPKTA